MQFTRFRRLSLIAMIIIILFSASILASNFDFKPVVIEKISRYNEDRIAYQHIQNDFGEKTDDSIATLLIIKEKQIYLLKDGYDDPEKVREKRLMLSMENQLIPDLWKNKINEKPDFIRITSRRIERMKNFDEDFVSKSFGTFYQNVRNAFLNKHVEIFKQLMIGRKDSGLIVDRVPLPKPTYINAPETETKYKITVSAKTIDEKIYYAEDADGDGITETFTVSIPDGFNWGYKSGPNIIFIYNNKVEVVQNIIGNLSKWAYYGTPEEEEKIMKTFPKDSQIIDQFDLEKVAGQQSQ